MTRALILNAVSTPEQARKFSLDHQEEVSRAYCAAQGWEVIDSLRSDTSRSKHDNIDDIAKVNKAFAALRQHIEAKDFDALVIHSFDRLARDAPLVAQIIQRIIRAGAFIFAHQGGTVDARNYLAISGSIGFMVAAPIATFVEKTQVTKHQLAKRGLPSVGPPWSHRAVRDGLGKRMHLEVREELRPLWDAIYTLLVDQHQSFHNFGEALAKLGFVQANGKPHHYGKIFRLLHHPVTWGHVAMNWHAKKHDGHRTDGPWAYDKAIAPPPHVEMTYDVTQPIWTGVQAERIIAELRYRAETVSGKTTPTSAYAFTGLLVCASCGWSLQVWSNRKSSRLDGTYYVAWRCMSPIKNRLGCGTSYRLSDKEVRRQLDLRLGEFLATDDFSELTGHPIVPPAEIDRLQREVSEAERELRGLLRDSANADEDLLNMYGELISKARDRLKAARAAFEAIKYSNDSFAAQDQAAAIDDLKHMRLDGLWALPDHDLNRFLHRLLANRRLVIANKQIIGLALKK